MSERAKQERVVQLSNHVFNLGGYLPNRWINPVFHPMIPPLLVSPPAAATPPTLDAHNGVHNEHNLAHIVLLGPQPLPLCAPPSSQRRPSRTRAQQARVKGTLLPGMLSPSSATIPRPISQNPTLARQATGCDIRQTDASESVVRSHTSFRRGQHPATLCLFPSKLLFVFSRASGSLSRAQ